MLVPSAFDPAPALPLLLPRARAPCVRPGHPHPSSPRPRPITLDPRLRPLLAARARFRYLDPGPHPRSPRPRPIPLGSRFALDSAGSAFEPAARVCLAVQFSCVARLVGAVRIPVSRNVSRETSVRVGGGGAGWDPCRRAPCDGSFPCAWKRMLAMHDSSPSPFLPTWCFPPRLRRQAPIIVHSEHSLPPRFPAFCGRCRREPVRAERGGRRPLGWRPPRLAPPDWRGFPDLLPDWRAGSQS